MDDETGGDDGVFGTALHSAISISSLVSRWIETLISGADVHGGFIHSEYTPLYFVVGIQYDDLVKLLVSNKADVNSANPVNKHTPLCSGQK